MNDLNFTNINFQTFFVSKEEINSPIITEIAKSGKKIKECDLLTDKSNILISTKYGKRLIINDINIDFEHINRNDFLEIVDYDPVKNILLVIGQKEPNIDTPIHWMIINARKDINSIIQINDYLLSKRFIKKITSVENENHVIILERVKNLLKVLRDKNIIVIKNKGIIFINNNLKDNEKFVLKTLGD